MRTILVGLLGMIMATSANAELPKVYLHCVGSSKMLETTKHAIAIFSKTADVDGSRYDLGASETRYAILEKTVAEMLGGPPTLIDIDRLTGDYEISVGAGSNALQETGHCDKVHRQF
jgi:hypothetical protein